MSATPMLIVCIPLEGSAHIISTLENENEIERLADWIGRDGDARATLVLDFLRALRELDSDDRPGS